MIQQDKTANRGDRFLVLYNQLVDYFRARVEADEWVTFSALVKEISIGNSAVRYHKRQLLKYGELRNAIVHSKTYPDVSIADLHDDTLADFERITEAILAPTKLATQFQKNIRVFDGDEPLVDALRYMKANNFSQVVVRADGRLRLLTTEGVTEWLASQADADIISVRDARVGNALAFDTPDRMFLMRGDRTVFDAYAAFIPTKAQPRLYAIIVTHNGKTHEAPLGLVTPWDVLQEPSATSS